MTDQDIPEEVRQLILESIPSVAELEAILLLRGNPEQQWTTESVARRLYIEQALAEAVLKHLHDRGFCAVREEEVNYYRFRPRSAELSQRIDKLAETYKHRLVAVTNLIHARRDASLQHFADAFKLRKEG